MLRWLVQYKTRNTSEYDSSVHECVIEFETKPSKIEVSNAITDKLKELNGAFFSAWPEDKTNE